MRFNTYVKYDRWSSSIYTWSSWVGNKLSHKLQRDTGDVRSFSQAECTCDNFWLSQPVLVTWCCRAEWRGDWDACSETVSLHQDTVFATFEAFTTQSPLNWKCSSCSQEIAIRATVSMLCKFLSLMEVYISVWPHSHLSLFPSVLFFKMEIYLWPL